MKNDNVKWLTSTPPNDMNFVLHLQYASENEIMEAISAVEKSGGKRKKDKTDSLINNRLFIK